MEPVFALTPDYPLFRVGRKPNPLDWAPPDRVGDGRFDDPHSPAEYRVLYAGDRKACFLEVLANFRPDLIGVVTNPLTRGWIENRRVATFHLQDVTNTCRWLDFRAAQPYQFFRKELASLLVGNNLSDFDLSAATSGNREITQRISRWAFDQGCCGIVYRTRFDANLNCWAIFERPNKVLILPGAIEVLDSTDNDLVTVCEIHQLSLPSRVI